MYWHYFNEIVNEAAVYWRRLGRLLGASDEEIDRIGSMWPIISYQDQMRCILNDWAYRQIRKNQYCDISVLLDALSKAELKLVERRIREMAYPTLNL